MYFNLMFSFYLLVINTQYPRREILATSPDVLLNQEMKLITLL